MTRKVFAFFTAFSLLFSFSFVFAKQETTKHFAPEMEVAKDGVYDVPGREDMKVRVFVHKEKAKPGASSQALSCGLTDPDSGSVTGATGWHLPSSIAYRLNPASVPASVGGGNLATIVNSSFAQWQTALASSSPNILLAGTTTVNRSRYDGQNVIAWGRTSGNSLGVTYTWYYTATHEVAEVDTIMNSRVAWTWNGGGTVCADPNAYDAQNIMIHELGHWYGLDDEYESGYVNNTMYGYGSKGEVKKDTLTSGDVYGIRAIYP